VSAHDEEVEREGEGVRVTDRRRIDPETFEVRQQAAGAPDDLASQAAVVEGDVQAVEGKVAELTEDLQRVHAEYANYRKRVEREREVLRDLAVANALTEILPVLDDIDRAREHDELHGAFKTVGENLEQAVTKLGLERFGAEGEAFDPNLHEALTSEANDEVSEPTVIRVYQPGYRFGDRVMRPARVAVAGTD
jgi:molecular chaperone GrpE